MRGRVLFFLVASMWITSASATAPLQDALIPGGIQAARILHLWHVTLALCSLVFVVLVLAALIALLRAPRASEASPPDLSSIQRPEPGLCRAVVLATAISAALLLGLVALDVLTDRALARLPADHALHIEMTGHQWWWQASYQDADPAQRFVVANEFHIPVGRPVIISLVSADVIHSFWAPSLHGKKDMIPGRAATIELRADRAGTYRGQCAEFCGAEHALMAFLVVAQPSSEYEAWAAAQRAPANTPLGPEAQRGQQIFEKGNCAQCHTIRGSGATGALGPDLTHLASRRTIAAGPLVNSQDNLAAWIRDPGALKPATMMPANALAPADLHALLAFLETLK